MLTTSSVYGPWASPALGIDHCRASTTIGVAHLEGVTSCTENVLWPRWCHPRYPQVEMTVEGAA